MVVHMDMQKKMFIEVNIPLRLATKSVSRKIGVLRLKLDTERLREYVQSLVREQWSQVLTIRIITTRWLTQIVQLPRENLVNFRTIWSALWKKSSGRLQITRMLLPLKQQRMIIASRHWKLLLIPIVGRLELTQNHLELSKIRLPEIVTSWILWLPIKRNLKKRLIMTLIMNT